MTYRQIFDEAIGEAPPTAVDVELVIARERRTALIRPVVVAAVVMLVTAGVTVAIGAGDYRAAPPVRPDSPPVASQVDYFPAYLDGTRIVAEATATLADGEVRLTFVPSVPQHQLTFFIKCETDDPTSVQDMRLSLRSGVVTFRDSCHEESVGPSRDWPLFARTGEPSTVTLSIGGGDPGPAAAGRFGVAVGEPVPFEEYPLPARPTVLPALDPSLSALEERLGAELATALGQGGERPDPGDRVEIRADRTDPTEPRQVTTVWLEAFEVGMRAQTPGYLHLLVDEVPVDLGRGPVAVWDYRQDEVWHYLGSAEGWTDPPPQLGDEVTITVVPEHLTGDWVLVLDPLPEALHHGP